MITSAITALAKQTEDRIMRDFKKSGVKQKKAQRLNLLDNAYNEDASDLEDDDPFAKGMAWGFEA